MALKTTPLSLLLIGVIAVLLVIFFIVVPLKGRWDHMNQQIALFESAYRQDSTQLEHLDAYIELFKRYEGRVHQTRSDEEEIAFFLKEIEGFAEGLSVHLNDIKPLETRTDNSRNVFLIEIEIETSAQEFMALLHTIAVSEELICVESFDVSAATNNQEWLTVTLILAKTFIR